MGTEHGFSQMQQDMAARIAAFWQEVSKTQVAGVEALVGKVDVLVKEHMERAQTRFDEASKLVMSTMQWATELQTKAMGSALDAMRAASKAFQTPRD